MKKTLKIAVRDLVAHVLRSGDLSFEFLSSARPVDAIRIHQKIQQSRPANYSAEVAVSHLVETELFRLTIGGRVDGIYRDSDKVMIEEIKTTTRSLDYVENHENPIHWGQVKAYAYIYALDQDLEALEAQLTYYQTDTGEIRNFKKHFRLTDLQAFFQDLVANYLQWAATIVHWEVLRDESIRKTEFPFGDYRPGQREMAVGVYRTIKNNGQQLIQAATGIGKTMAAIFPAVKAIGEGLTTKIFYLTARTTGRFAAEYALEELRTAGLKLKSLTITAKDKTCFNPDRACNPEECEFARGHFDRIDKALGDIFGRDAFTRAAVEQVARDHQVCPFEFALELALWADCIICDYNYAFDPRVYLRRFFLEENGEYAFLVDEAHNLVDRSREMFSAEIYKQPLLDLRRAIGRNLPHIYKSLGKINSWMIKARKKCEESATAHHETDPPEDLFPLLRGFLRITERWLSRDLKTPFREELLDLFFVISGFIRVSEQYDDCYVTCYEKIKKDVKLKLFCLNPARQLGNALKRCRAAVFFSATLTPMDYFKNILGCDPRAAALILPSPFPVENFKLFVYDRISTLYRQRDNTKEQVARAISSLVSQKTGNYLVFFPSYEYMMMVFDAFQAECPDGEVIIQAPGMSEHEREEFLNRFGKENHQSLIGFAVMGGIFGEGIDLVGDRLSGAVVVGVGLPGISLEKELIRDYFAVHHNTGFEYAYQYPGINRVLQAAGRVIRTEIDQGVVLLIDQRYGTHRYRSLLPAEWRPVRVQSGEQLGQALQKFWKR
ncbi:MAG: ATP-dependent DNA helicase [Desulfobacteraceae bacterium]|nr:ATP-dependent DNA helicase [Desulfobacteraceae bacterium]